MAPHPSAAVALSGLAGSALFLGLAVLGWGGFAAYFADPARTVLAIVMVVASLSALFTEANLSAGEQEDRGNRWVLAAFGVLGLLGAYLPAYSDRHDFWVLDGAAVRWTGVAVTIAGIVLRMAPVFVLGRRFSGLVAIQPGHRLVTTGLYGVIRHPSYLGLLVLSVGWGLGFRSVIGVLLAVLNIVPIVARIDAEEALLRAHFGAEYDAYRVRTARLIPGLY